MRGAVWGQIDEPEKGLRPQVVFNGKTPQVETRGYGTRQPVPNLSVAPGLSPEYSEQRNNDPV